MKALEEALSAHHPKPIGNGVDYALFVPLVWHNHQWCLLYERRAAQMRRQPSEICFAGGKIDQGETIEEAALRELWEELGVKPKKIYGASDFLVLRTGNVVYPVVGELQENPQMHFSKGEVERVIFAPVKTLLSQEESYEVQFHPQAQFPPSALSLKEDYPFRSGRDVFPVYRVEGEIIWGITGHITKSVLQMLKTKEENPSP